MPRAPALVIALALAVAGTSCDEPLEAHPGVHHASVLGPSSTSDDSDPRIPRVPRERVVMVASDDPSFHLGLASDVIVEAHGFRPGWSLFEPARTGGRPALDDRAHRSLTASVDRVLVGDLPSAKVRFDVYCAQDDDHGVSCADLRALVANPDQRAVLFLQYVSGTILYFAGYTPLALQTAIPEREVAAIRALRRGARARLERAPRAPITAHVAREVDRMTRSPREQYDAIRGLIALGPEAIPAIVRRMDDRRPLPSAGIMLENAPDFFEGYGHYSIGTVSDALSIVAGRLSNGPSCDQLLHAREDGTSEESRSRCHQRWIEYTARGLADGAFGEAWR